MKNKIFNLSKIAYIVLLATSFSSLSNFSHAQNVQVNINNKNNIKKTEVSDRSSNKILYKGTTLDKVKSSGKIVIGVRSSAVPVSYTEDGTESKQPIGYAVDICNLIAEQYKDQNKLTGIKTEYMFIKPKNRIGKLNAGDIDLDCEIATNSEEIRKEVHFSVPYFISSDKILTLNIRKDIVNLDSLVDKSVGFIKNTATDRNLDRYNEVRGMKINKVEFESPEDGFKALASKKIDAFLYHDSVVYALKINSENPADYKILPETLDVEVSSIMMRNNDQDFSLFVDNTLKDLMKSGQVELLYKKWFLSPIAPKNKTLGLEMPKNLKDVFRYPTTIIGN